MEKSTQTTFDEIKEINLKLEQIHSVLGFILEKTNLIPEPPVIVAPEYNSLHHFPEIIDENKITDIDIPS